jgi:filamentous hemagglutinin family protein
MGDVENFIYEYEDNQREILFYFHKLLTIELNLTDKIRFNIPFYYGKSWICYLNPIKKSKIELAFIRGNELSNVQGILNSKGRKQVYGVEFEEISKIPMNLVYEIIHEAILLDEIKPYKSKNRGQKF